MNLPIKKLIEEKNKLDAEIEQIRWLQDVC